MPPRRFLAAFFSFLALAACLHAAPAQPPLGQHDAFVFLSGGGSPLSNQYSQYLQAQAMSRFLQQTYPADAVWIFFGMGNRPGVTPEIADVHRKYKADGLLLDNWLVGELPKNRPATREEFLPALRKEILPRVAQGGTLYLFVGDHGELAKTASASGEADSKIESPKSKTSESAITLWQLKHTESGGWRTDKDEVLTVSELRQELKAGLGKGRVVFCMTQCHSGGFHFLSVPRAIAGKPEWYRTGSISADAPDWSAALGDLPIAGFTATDEPSLAAGCAPDPDPDKWAGYERFVPELLLGVDLMDGSRRGDPLMSFADAHERATLIDRTIDKPYGTSDQFLDRWARWIEEASAKADALEPQIAREFGVYSAFVNGKGPIVRDAAFLECRAQFERFTQSLIQRNPSMESLLTHGTAEELTAAMGPESSRPGRPRGPRRDPAQMKSAWTDVIRPAWSEAIKKGEIKDVPPASLAFEKFLLKQEAKGVDVTSPSQRDTLLNWTYWQSSLAFPTRIDRSKAAAVTRWAVQRRRYIIEWAKKSPDEAVRAAVEKWAPGYRPNETAAAPAPRPESASMATRVDHTAVERVMFYRRVLGAWAFLLAVHEDEALARLHTLIALEQTPLPQK